MEKKGNADFVNEIKGILADEGKFQEYIKQFKTEDSSKIFEIYELRGIFNNYMHTNRARNLTDLQFQKIIEKFDKDGNGTIDENEFSGFFRHLLEKIVSNSDKSSKAVEEFNNALKDKEALKKMAEDHFQKLDKDNDGTIDKEELIKIFNIFSERIKVSAPSEKKFSQIFEKFDKDKNGKLDPKEFEKFLATILQFLLSKIDDSAEKEVEELSEEDKTILFFKEKLENKNKLTAYGNELFDSLDNDKSGQLSKDELSEVFKKLSFQAKMKPPTPEKLSEMVEKFDKDKTGVFHIKEFNCFLTQIFKFILKKLEEKKIKRTK